jgi:hypothetical protein
LHSCQFYWYHRLAAQFPVEEHYLKPESSIVKILLRWQVSAARPYNPQPLALQTSKPSCVLNLQASDIQDQPPEQLLAADPTGDEEEEEEAEAPQEPDQPMEEAGDAAAPAPEEPLETPEEAEDVKAEGEDIKPKVEDEEGAGAGSDPLTTLASAAMSAAPTVDSSAAPNGMKAEPAAEVKAEDDKAVSSWIFKAIEMHYRGEA